MFHGGFSWSLWFSVEVIKCPYPCVNAEAHQKKIYTKIKFTCELTIACLQTLFRGLGRYAFMLCVWVSVIVYRSPVTISIGSCVWVCVCVIVRSFRHSYHPNHTIIFSIASYFPTKERNKKLPIAVISLAMKSPIRSTNSLPKSTNQRF